MSPPSTSVGGADDGGIYMVWLGYGGLTVHLWRCEAEETRRTAFKQEAAQESHRPPYKLTFLPSS